MKFLQLNINSLNTSTEELWDYQKENNYEGIFCPETNYTAGKMLGKFKHWKTKMHTIYRNKNSGFGVATLIPTSVSNVFRDDLTSDNLESVWSEMKTKGKVVLIGNIYIAAGNENQLHGLDNELKQHKDKSILLAGDFNSRSNTWDKNIRQSNKMGKTLEDIINRYGLNIATDPLYTFKRRDNSGKITIDLTLTRELKHVKVKIKEIETIKTEHQAIEINTQGKDETIISNPKFKTEKANWVEWKESLKPHIEDSLEEYPTEITEEEIDNQTKKLTDIIIKNVTLFFGQTDAKKKESKPWWSKDIKKSRNELKKANQRFKSRQSIANLETLQTAKIKYQQLIKESKIKDKKTPQRS